MRRKRITVPRGAIEKRKNLPPHLAKLYEEQSLSTNTQRNYAADIRSFWEWCRVHGRPFLPCSPTDLCECLAEQSDEYSHATLRRWAASVSWSHRGAGYDGDENPRKNPMVAETLKKIARKQKDRQTNQARELTVEDVQQLITHCDEDSNPFRRARERALFLVGFSSALRVSNLVAIEVNHLKFVPEGIELSIPWSKTDQTGEGRTILIRRGGQPETCPVEALQDWLRLAKIKDDRVFRRLYRCKKIDLSKPPVGKSLSTDAVTQILQRNLKEMGFEEWAEYSSHSFRSGWATSAARAGVSLQAIMSKGGWSDPTTALRYIRKGSRWEDEASLGL